MSRTPTQELILELLTARHRLGEQVWTLNANGPIKKALTALEGAGLVGWKSGVVDGTYLAWLTDDGRAEYLSPSYVPPAETTTAQVVDAAHLARQREWSARTFGPGLRTAGVLDHIRKELAEIEADPTDVGEWVDVVTLALDGAWRAGWEPQAIIDAIHAKQDRNETRSWPDWRTADPDKAIEHDRTDERTGLAREPHPIIGRRIRVCRVCGEEAAYCDGSRHQETAEDSQASAVDHVARLIASAVAATPDGAEAIRIVAAATLTGAIRAGLLATARHTGTEWGLRWRDGSVTTHNAPVHELTEWAADAPAATLVHREVTAWRDADQ